VAWDATEIRNVAKLTLSIDASITKRAKRYATRHGTSLSALVELYLGPITIADRDLPPVTRRLRGILKGASYSRKAYIGYLERKYR
jgi:Family of unknown function (DUF6364)